MEPKTLPSGHIPSTDNTLAADPKFMALCMDKYNFHDKNLHLILDPNTSGPHLLSHASQLKAVFVLRGALLIRFSPSLSISIQPFEPEKKNAKEEGGLDLQNPSFFFFN